MTFEQPKSVDVPMYVTVQPQFHPNRRDDQGRPILVGANLVKATKTPPASTPGTSLTTAITLRVEAEALVPLAPRAVVHIKADGIDVIETHAGRATASRERIQVTYSTDEPKSPDEGDLWIVLARLGGSIEGFMRWDGESWQPIRNPEGGDGDGVPAALV